MLFKTLKHIVWTSNQITKDNQRKKFMTNLVEGHKKYKEKEKECFEKEKKRLEEKN